MRNLILDLDALAVDSFSTSAGDLLAAPDDFAGVQTAVACTRAENGTGADTYVSCAAPAALTEAYPCKTTR